MGRAGWSGGEDRRLARPQPVLFCSPCRDVAWLGDCDQGCLALADLLGWKVRSWATSAHPEPRPMGIHNNL